jgi:hypothetical protein
MCVFVSIRNSRWLALQDKVLALGKDNYKYLFSQTRYLNESKRFHYKFLFFMSDFYFLYQLEIEDAIAE